MASAPSPRVPSPSQNGGGAGQRIATLPGIVGLDRAKTPVPIAPAGTSASAAAAYGAGPAAPIHVAGVPSLLTGAPGTGTGVHPLVLGTHAGVTVQGAGSSVSSHAAGAETPGVSASIPSLQPGVGVRGCSPRSLPQPSQGGGAYVPGGELTASTPQGEGGIGAVGGITQPSLATGATASTYRGETTVGGGEGLLRVSGKINLVYKLMVSEGLYEKMKASREPGYDRAAFTWKTTDDEYRKHQKPMFEEVLEAWEELTTEKRRKYGCTNYESTPYPTMSTAKSFFTDASKSYHKYKNRWVACSRVACFFRSLADCNALLSCASRVATSLARSYTARIATRDMNSLSGEGGSSLTLAITPPPTYQCRCLQCPLALLPSSQSLRSARSLRCWGCSGGTPARRWLPCSPCYRPKATTATAARPGATPLGERKGRMLKG